MTSVLDVNVGGFFCGHVRRFDRSKVKKITHASNETSCSACIGPYVNVELENGEIVSGHVDYQEPIDPFMPE